MARQSDKKRGFESGQGVEKRSTDTRRHSGREARALLWLLPALAIASWLIVEIAKTEPSDTQSDTHNFGQSGADVALTEVQGGRDSTNSTALSTERGSAADAPLSPELFNFDPNTIEYHDLIRLGFERGEALGIIKYRERGKIFEIPEDFAACYQVTESMYRRLQPYIKIGERFRLKPFAPRPPATPTSTPATRTTIRPNETRTPPPTTTTSRPNTPLPLVELNTADSTTLVAVRGIGAITVVRIIEYRTRLGGFAAVEQLAEVAGVTEQNYELMSQQIYVDVSAIQKIDINFAPAQSLARHPYMRAPSLRKLLKQRQLKGGWRTLAELKNDDIFTPEELTKLGPYLSFN
ncbi:MAG: helix-hairpin-helix domain-containing protein [Alistipes sp.]|jgi:DNA uptake protein ComE-like DNA-binding protein|nr:helix-hairpin-helix domain-containing protein [Alistipes sp.]